ncbi:GerAB/ArcD/ProY family transporter [Paenibacillus taichungensis]|uniref:GerAB/ArcD/ProY family transporter n=1 Tax=Paenibacillus taichungensis TaxID=484184 RepID=UPI0035E36E7F
MSAVGPKTVCLLAAVGLIPLFFKTSVIALGYSGIVHEYIFRVMNKSVPLIAILLMSCYLASHGMEKTLRFIVIAFLGSIWLILCYLPFYFPPVADYKQLYPLIPISPPLDSWKGIVICWSALSGPEYLIFLVPWLKPDRNTLKHLTIANLFTILEDLLLFVATVLYYGQEYLKTAGYPVLNMISYLQSPIFERIEILLISFLMFSVVFVVSLFLLMFYGALQITLGKTLKKTPDSYI